jgi:drug/metabolite transporter (DMT)-like permease
MKALAILPTALVFPATLVGPMLLAAITSVLIFREKIKAEGFAGLAIAAVGLVLLSMNAK